MVRWQLIPQVCNTLLPAPLCVQMCVANMNSHDSDSQDVLLTTDTELGYFFLENATREALIATPETGTSKKGVQLAED